MALPPSNSAQRITLAALGQGIARQRDVVGEVPIPRNAGTRRTASKFALLAAIEDTGGRW